jgi:hypothetical protein
LQLTTGLTFSTARFWEKPILIKDLMHLWKGEKSRASENDTAAALQRVIAW